jgi:hypothetical protein
MVSFITVSGMVVVLVTCGAGLAWSRRRRHNDPVFRRSRALAALGDITQLAHRTVPTCHPNEPLEHVSLIEGGGEARSRSRQVRASQKHRRKHRHPGALTRPTIAVLPKLIGDTSDDNKST